MIASIPFPESQKSIVDSSLLNEDSLNNEVIGSDIRRFGEFNVQQEDAFNTGILRHQLFLFFTQHVNAEEEMSLTRDFNLLL